MGLDWRSIGACARLCWFLASCQMQAVRIYVSVVILHPALSWFEPSNEPFWPLLFQSRGLSLEGELEGLYNTEFVGSSVHELPCSLSASKAELKSMQVSLLISLFFRPIFSDYEGIALQCSSTINKKEIKSPNNLALMAWKSDLHVALLHWIILLDYFHICMNIYKLIYFNIKLEIWFVDVFYK